MLLVKLVHTGLYCVYNEQRQTVTISNHRRRVGPPIWRVSLVVLVFALAVMFAPGQIKNLFADSVLARTRIGLLPETVAAAPKPLAARFQAETNTLQNLLAKKTPGNPEELGRVRDRMEQVVENLRLPPKTRANAIDEIVNLQGYEVFSRIQAAELKDGIIWKGLGRDVPSIIVGGANPAFSIDRPFLFEDIMFISAKGSSQNEAIAVRHPNLPVVVLNATFEELTQRLDGITWIDVTFRRSTIVYDGGPVYMSKVKFIDCYFRMPPGAALSYFENGDSSGVSYYQPPPATR